jgi:hypothetical protein
VSVRRPSKTWPRKSGTGQIEVPEAERDTRTWQTERPNGFLIEEIGTPVPRLPEEAQAVLTKDTPETPAPAPQLAAKVPLPDIPSASATERMRNHRALNRNA